MPTISKAAASALRSLGYKNVRAGKISAPASVGSKRVVKRKPTVKIVVKKVVKRELPRPPKSLFKMLTTKPKRKKKTVKRKVGRLPQPPKSLTRRKKTVKRKVGRLPQPPKSLTRRKKKVGRKKKKVNLTVWPVNQSAYVPNPLSDLLNKPLPANPRKALPSIPSELYQTYNPAPFIPIHDVELGRNYAPYIPNPADIAAINNIGNNEVMNSIPARPQGYINQIYPAGPPPPPIPPRKNKNQLMPPLIDLSSVQGQPNQYRRPLPLAPPLYYNPNPNSIL